MDTLQRVQFALAVIAVILGAVGLNIAIFALVDATSSLSPSYPSLLTAFSILVVLLNIASLIGDYSQQRTLKE